MRMRSFLVSLLSSAILCAQEGKPEAVRKWTDEEKIEMIRGLMAEYATVKTFLPRSKKALEIKNNGTWDKTGWQERGVEFGPVARAGDAVQITKVDVEDDRIVLQINGGLNTRGKWYERIEGGMGGSGTTVPLSKNQTRSAGTSVALVWDGKMPPIKPAEAKKLLKPVLDFDRRSATESYFDNLPPEIQEAIKAKKAVVGMDRDQVKMAMGQPRDRIRQSNDGVESEDWIYGLPPGKITFVTFQNGKVTNVKDHYAGLGGTTAPPLKSP
jgi:hypothetical protein